MLRVQVSTVGAGPGAQEILGRTPDLPEVSPCPDCVERAAAAEAAEIAEAEASRRRRDAAAREEEVLAMIEAAGANPWDHGDSTFETFDASASPTALAAVQELVERTLSAGRYEPIRGVYLFGDTGNGKTTLAVAAIRALVTAGVAPRDIVFDHALSLITKIQDTYNTGESTQDILERREKARFWVLDDLGTERPSDDVVRRLTKIFAERGRRPTLVTSNLTPDQLTDPKRHPEFFRLRSRLGPRQFRVIQLQGPDRRFTAP